MIETRIMYPPSQFQNDHIKTHLEIRVLLSQGDDLLVPVAFLLVVLVLAALLVLTLDETVVLDGGEGVDDVRAEAGVDVVRRELARSRSLLGPAGHVAEHLRRSPCNHESVITFSIKSSGEL